MFDINILQMLKSKIYEKGVPSRNFPYLDFYSAHGGQILECYVRYAGESDWRKAGGQ